MSAWAIQSLQLVWFGSGLDALQADTVYSAAFGLEAETIQRNRVPGPANPFWGTASGMINQSTRAELQIQPGRCNLIFLASDAEASPTMPLQFLHDVGGAAETLAGIGRAVRIAAVGEIVSMAESASHATSIAQQLVSMPSLSDVMDFSLQLNRRVSFPCDDTLSMNRLLRWSTATFQMLRIQLPEAGGEMVPVGTISNAAAVKIDLNNVPTSRLLDSELQIAMYKDLLGELIRLSANPTLSQLMDGP